MLECANVLVSVCVSKAPFPVRFIINPVTNICASIGIGISSLPMEKIIYERPNINIAIGVGEPAVSVLLITLESAKILISVGPCFGTFSRFYVDLKITCICAFIRISICTLPV